MEIPKVPGYGPAYIITCDEVVPYLIILIHLCALDN